MSSPFSPTARALLRRASAEAAGRRHARVTAEHLLRAMVKDQAASRILLSVGVDLLGLADELERHLAEHAAPRRWWSGPVPRFDAPLLRALQRAAVQGQAAGPQGVGPGEILAAILVTTGDGTRAGDLLRGQGVTQLDLLRYLSHGLHKGAMPPGPAGALLGSGPHQVVLHNDHYTTMEFVVSVLEHVFDRPRDEAIRIMLAVHEKGRGVAGVYPADLARTKAADVVDLGGQAGFPLLCSLEPAPRPP